MRFATHAPGKVEPRVGDVDVVGEHRDADRVDALGLRAEQLLEDLDVVDHQVAHHVDVGAALRERPEPVDLGEARPVDLLAHHAHRRVEPLLVADLEHARAAAPRARRARRPRRSVAAIGFSTSTSRPASSARRATS